jgi:hypothetical protein
VIVQRYRCGNAFPSRQVLARFDHIAGVIAAPGERATDDIALWSTSPNQSLAGRSPTEYLAD